MPQTKEGALKAAATRIGISHSEYQSHLDKDEKWCSMGKHWVHRWYFGKNRAKPDGLARHCRDCVRPYNKANKRRDRRFSALDSFDNPAQARWKVFDRGERISVEAKRLSEIGEVFEIGQDEIEANNAAVLVKPKPPERKFVVDKKGFVWAIARSFYRFLVIWESESIHAIANAADFLFPGPRVEKNEFRRIIHRKLYHTARELGWRKVNSKWRKDECYEERR